MDANKLTTKDPTLENTSMRAWMVSGWNSLVAQNGFPILDTDRHVHPIVNTSKKPPFLTKKFSTKRDLQLCCNFFFILK